MEPLCKTVLKCVVLLQTAKKKNDHRGSLMPFKEQLLSATAGGLPGHGAAGAERQSPLVLVYLPESDLVYLLSEEGDVADLRRGARGTYWGRETCYKSCQEPLCRAGSSHRIW